MQRNALVNGVNQFGPVKDTSSHVSTENPAELVLVQPRTLDVIDLEFDVWWYKRWHAGAKVVSNHLERGLMPYFRRI